MPFRDSHNCIIDREVTEITGYEDVKTKWGVLQRVLGKDKKGNQKQRGLRIPVAIPLRVAEKICQASKGEFEPATPYESRKRLLADLEVFESNEKREFIEKLIGRFQLSGMQLAKWDTAYVNDLPDSAFALIVPGGKKDESGKTVPRSKRKLPYKDKNGKIDKAHLRNALARVNQAQAPAGLKRAALRKLLRVAKSVGIETQKREKYKLAELEWLLRMHDKLED